jgi:hypothetical protein
MIIQIKNDSEFPQNKINDFYKILIQPLHLDINNFEAGVVDIIHPEFIINYFSIKLYGFEKFENKIINNSNKNIIQQINIIFNLNNKNDDFKINLKNLKLEFNNMFEEIDSVMLKSKNNSEFLNSYFISKNLFKYISWSKFNNIKDLNFVNLINEIKSKLEKVLIQLKKLIQKFDRELLIEKNLFINKKSDIIEQSNKIKLKLNEYANKINNNINETIVIFDYNIISVEIQSLKYKNLIEISNNNYFEKLIELKINHKTIIEKININIFCDLISNANSLNQSHICTFKPNDECYTCFLRPVYFPINKSIINKINFYFKDFENNFIEFEQGEIIINLELRKKK